MRSVHRDTITVYNRRFPALRPPFPPDEGDFAWSRTVIRGALFRNKTHANPTPEGATFIGRTVSVTIPARADQGGKAYVSPHYYARLPADDLAHWTIRIDRANPDFIVLGEGPEIADGYGIADLERDYGDGRLMRPEAVRGGAERRIPQWKITGR